MKIKDVIKKVATMLQLNNVAEANFDVEPEQVIEETLEEVIEGATQEETIEENVSENDSQQNNTNQVTSIFETFDSQTKRDINLIISCINSVLCDIASDHIMLKTTESINVKNGEFALCELSNSFHRLKSVSTSKPYTVKNEALFIEDGTYKITYYYLPKEYGFDDEITDFNGKLTIYALCFGVAGEYCLISGNYSESEMWNSRFENAMQTAKRNVIVPEIRGRKWL